MRRIPGWLRTLDADVLAGRRRRVVVLPLAAFLGLLVGGTVGVYGVVGLGLLGLLGTDYATIVFPYLGALVGGAAGASLGVGLALRRCR